MEKKETGRLGRKLSDNFAVRMVVEGEEKRARRDRWVYTLLSIRIQQAKEGSGAARLT